MILQALVHYYELLSARGEISAQGWSNSKISYALELDDAGQLLAVLPLRTQPEGKKKPEPRLLRLPAAEKRTVGISSNFLWDNSSYLLGIDEKGDPERSKRCFADACTLHTKLLGEATGTFAKAICSFFANWDTETARDHPLVVEHLPDILTTNLVFYHRGQFSAQDEELCRCWQQAYDGEETGEPMTCLVTGQKAVPQKTHPLIKGVRGAQSSGAALISFNAPAYCSYGREQNLNAPMSKYAAFAYTTALNLLLDQREHVKRIGDSTVVYWAENAEPAYQDAFAGLLDAGGDEMQQTDLDRFMTAIASGGSADWNGVPLTPQNRFYVLGLAPNAARVSVRFFMQDSFGSMVQNLQAHYRRLEVAPDHRSRWKLFPLWALLQETMNRNATKPMPSPQLAGDMLRAILTGTHYPATLYQQTQLRIRAEREITMGRAAIIRAYLIHNANYSEEELTVQLNENTTYQPYLLGRLFSILEDIQQKANPGINATIKDKYFTSACATPASVFPTLLNLSEKHMRKLEGGFRVNLAKQKGLLMAAITESYPAHHTLYDQGIFQLGYYHQTQKRYEKKEKNIIE